MEDDGRFPTDGGKPACPSGKERHSLQEARTLANKMRRNKGEEVEAYQCDLCGDHHIGHAPGSGWRRTSPGRKHRPRRRHG